MTQPNDPIDPGAVDPDELTRAVPAPEASAPEPAAPLEPPTAAAPAPAPAAPELAPGPIVSWTPSGYDPAAPGPGPVGWQQPEGPAAPGVEADGDRIATTWPRLIAYWIDILLINLIPGALSLAVVDWDGIFRDSLDAAQNPGAPAPAYEMGLEGILLSLVGVALGYIYFVGLWTSGGGATLGMRGLKMRLRDASTGGTVSLVAASKRWVALGGPLPLLGLVGPLASISGLASAGLALVLLISTATDARRQGIHDKWANTIVTRAPSSGAGATVAGCLVLLVATAAITTIAWTLLIAQLLPILEDYLLTIGG